MNNKNKRALITTPLGLTWATDRPFTLLGRWCLTDIESSELEDLYCKIAPYHWDDRRQLASDYKKLHNLYEVILLELQQSLNDIHGVDHSLRYWRILLGPWLECFIQIAYDRWASVEAIANNQEEYETIVIGFDAYKMIPNNMSRFGVMRNDDKWNHYIYGIIIREFSAISVIEKEDIQGVGVIDEHPSVLTLDKKNVVLLWIERLLSPLVRDSDAFFLATYLPFWEQFKLQLSLRQFPIIRSAREMSSNYVPRREYREWKLESTTNASIISSSFENWLRRFIPSQLPTVYLEGYKSQLAMTKSNHWPRSPKVIWTSVLYQEHDFFKLWAAEKVERGAKLIIGQHGGNYGMAKWNSSEDHQVAISDAYFSWGWSDTSKPNIIPVGQLKSLPAVKRERLVRKQALLVTMEMPRYSYYMFSSVVAGQWLDYLHDQFEFINVLPQKIRESFVIRLKYNANAWQTKIGWNSQKRWQKQFPEINIDSGSCGFHSEIMKYQLVISTYNAATYLESMAMDIPTVIFWNPEYWELRGEAAEYMKELEEVGIFHSTPASAAKHVEMIWGDVATWWESDSVQYAKDTFCRKYAALPDGMIKNIKNIINDLS